MGNYKYVPTSDWHHPPTRWVEIYRSDLDGSNIELVGGGGRNGIALDIPRPTSVLTPDSWPERPAASGLLFNYPNPFNASTQIAYYLATPGLVRLTIYDVLGQPVRTLVKRGQAAGFYKVLWDARNHQGGLVASGVYITRMYYPGGVETRRLLYLK